MQKSRDGCASLKLFKRRRFKIALTLRAINRGRECWRNLIARRFNRATSPSLSALDFSINAPRFSHDPRVVARAPSPAPPPSAARKTEKTRGPHAFRWTEMPCERAIRDKRQAYSFTAEFLSNLIAGGEEGVCLRGNRLIGYRICRKRFPREPRGYCFTEPD